MDGLHIVLVALLGVASCSRDFRSKSALEVTVRQGDNITLYCDCKISGGVYIVWYKRCSHENQPPLVLKGNHRQPVDNTDTEEYHKIPPTFQFVRNFSSESYDLLIMNITDSNEGLYYCGTEQTEVKDEKDIYRRSVYRYGNVTTRIVFNSSPDPRGGFTNPVLVGSWMMVFTPAFTILASVLSFILVYYICQKTDKDSPLLQERPDPRGHTRWDQDEDACFTRVVFRPVDRQTRQ